MTVLLTDKRHEEEYPKPAWLRGDNAHRALAVQDFPVHSYTATLLAYPDDRSPIVDGDTIDVEVVLREGEPSGLGKITVAERIRILGYNAPETRGVPDPQPGYDAEMALGRLIGDSTIYMVTYYDRRSFNRILAWCYLDGGGDALIDVAAYMIDNGYGVAA